MLRILLVDGHCVVREGLRGFLGCDAELEIVGEAADGTEMVVKARQLRPDIVLMDLLLPGMDGFTAISILRRDLPGLEVVVLTSVADGTSVMRAIQAGAIGYLLKDIQAAELRKAIKAAAAGQLQLSPQVSSYLLDELRTPQSEPTGLLTCRETDVLNLLVQGYPNKAIARTLHISEDTVKTHIHHIMSKLGVQSRTQAILTAMDLGLVAQKTKFLEKEKNMS
jgi:two-component system, NarL family, response regulator LiaR